MKFRPVLLIFAAAVAASVISCRDAGDEGGPTPAEAAYLDSVERAWSLFGSRLDEFGALFGQAWPLPSLMYQALEDAGTAVDETLAALQKLETPERYRADHEVMLVLARDMASLDRDVGRSVADEDAVALAMAKHGAGAGIRAWVAQLGTPGLRGGEPPERGQNGPTVPAA